MSIDIPWEAIQKMTTGWGGPHTTGGPRRGRDSYLRLEIQDETSAAAAAGGGSGFVVVMLRPRPSTGAVGSQQLVDLAKQIESKLLQVSLVARRAASGGDGVVPPAGAADRNTARQKQSRSTGASILATSTVASVQQGLRYSSSSSSSANEDDDIEAPSPPPRVAGFDDGNDQRSHTTAPTTQREALLEAQVRRLTEALETKQAIIRRLTAELQHWTGGALASNAPMMEVERAAALGHPVSRLQDEEEEEEEPDHRDYPTQHRPHPVHSSYPHAGDEGRPRTQTHKKRPASGVRVTTAGGSSSTHHSAATADALLVTDGRLQNHLQAFHDYWSNHQPTTRRPHSSSGVVAARGGRGSYSGTGGTARTAALPRPATAQHARTAAAATAARALLHDHNGDVPTLAGPPRTVRTAPGVIPQQSSSSSSSDEAVDEQEVALRGLTVEDYFLQRPAHGNQIGTHRRLGMGDLDVDAPRVVAWGEVQDDPRLARAFMDIHGSSSSDDYDDDDDDM